MHRRRAAYTDRPPALWRWEWCVVIAVGIIVYLILGLQADSLPSRTGIQMHIVAGIGLFLLAAVMYGTRRYLLAGILAVPAGMFTFQLWRKTDVYAFVRQPGSLHFWEVSLLVALVAMGGVMLFSLLYSRRAANPKAPVSLTTIFCVGALLFGQCEVSLTHLNVAWDRSEPTAHVCTVEGNWEERVGRRIKAVSLLLDNGGEKIQFNRTESGGVEFLPGDMVIVQEYAGAFGEPYYLLKGKI